MHEILIALVVVWAISVIADHHRQRAVERRLNDSRIELLEQMAELDLPEHLEARRQALLNLVTPTPYRWRPVLIGWVALAILGSVTRTIRHRSPR